MSAERSRALLLQDIVANLRAEATKIRASAWKFPNAQVDGAVSAYLDAANLIEQRRFTEPLGCSTLGCSRPAEWVIVNQVGNYSGPSTWWCTACKEKHPPLLVAFEEWSRIRDVSLGLQAEQR